MNILLTGCAGYIGQVLLRRLADDCGNVVTGVDDLRYDQPIPGVVKGEFHFNEMDVMEYFNTITKENLGQFDAIIHLAAVVGAPACDAKKGEAERVNVRSVHSLLRALSEYNISRPFLIYPNTNSMYGSSEGICTEEAEGNPVSLYGQTKLQAEQAIRRYYYSRCIFRLATVFGASRRMRRDLMVNDFVWRAKFEKRIEVWEPHYMRNFVHVDDVCDAFIFALENQDKMRGQVFNLGNDALNMSKHELACLIAAQYKDCPVSIGEGNDPDQRNYIVSNGKLRQAGFEAKRPIRVKEIDEAYNFLPRYTAWMTNRRAGA